MSGGRLRSARTLNGSFQPQPNHRQKRRRRRLQTILLVGRLSRPFRPRQSSEMLRSPTRECLYQRQQNHQPRPSRTELLPFPPGRPPNATIPPAEVHRNTCWATCTLLSPTTTEPSAETPVAMLLKFPPGRSPRPTIPPPAVQRNASEVPNGSKLPYPTTTEPSAETAVATLLKGSPERSPKPMNDGAPKPTVVVNGKKIAMPKAILRRFFTGGLPNAMRTSPSTFYYGTCYLNDALRPISMCVKLRAIPDVDG